MAFILHKEPGKEQHLTGDNDNANYPKLNKEKWPKELPKNEHPLGRI